MRKILLSTAAIAALTVMSAEATAQQCPPGQECPPAGAPAAPPAASPDAGQPAMPEAAPPAGGEMQAPSGQQPEAPPESQQPAEGGTSGTTPPAEGATPDANAPAEGAQPEAGEGGSQTETQPSGETGSESSSQDQPGTSGAAEGQEAPASAETQVEVTQEQRVEIRNVVQEVNVTRVDVDFDINVGVAVPRTVVLHPLPERIVEIVPAYRGYLFFILTDGTIIIVHPTDLVIVTVITV